MARKIRTILTDDVDATAADVTVNFALDGVAYEIDLSDQNAKRLREQFASWTEKARRVGGRRKGAARRSDTPGDAGKIRKWAKENGHEVSDRGRVSQAIRDAYATAH